MIIIASDHAGYELKEKVKLYLNDKGIEYKDFGVHDTDSVNYAEIGGEVAKLVAKKDFEFGILICGTGIGMSIAANKVKEIRAACCSDYFSAKFTRLHNDANVLCFGARVVGEGTAAEMIDVFLNTPFEGGRHMDRIKTFADLENGN